MKKIISIALSVILLLVLAVPSAAAGGAPTAKEEVVYGILGPDGSAESVYVVNIFNTGDIVDYGDYTDVKNLTNADPISNNGGEITVASAADRFYYQGTLKTAELPWDFTITYTLDGKETDASRLAGADGALAIRIQAAQNPNADGAFFDNYALQIALSLDTALCENIRADGATVADAGADKQLSYIVLPGKGADFTVSADVHDFEMDAMTLSGIKLTLSMDIDDAEFSGQLGQLTDAISDLDDGAGELLDGVTQLKDGMAQYLTGLNTYKNGIGELSGGAAQVASGISGLAAGLNDLAAQGDALAAGAQSVQQGAFDSANAQLAGTGLPTLTPDNYSDVLSGNADFAELKAQLDSTVQFAQGVIGYTAGVTGLKDGAADLSGGASELSAAVSQTADGAQDLYNGAAQLNTALGDLRDGLAEYRDGTSQLRGETQDLQGDVSGQIDKLLLEISGGDEIKSFVSDKNTNITAVQFVMKTAAIELPEEEEAAVSEDNEPTFWDRLLALFGID